MSTDYVASPVKQSINCSKGKFQIIPYKIENLLMQKHSYGGYFTKTDIILLIINIQVNNR